MSAKKYVEQLCLFTVGDLLCGIDTDSVQEISKPIHITTVYHAPKSIVGVVNLRGHIATIIDLQERLTEGKSSGDRKSSQILFVNHSDTTLGLLVKNISDVIQTEKDDFFPVPSNFEHAEENFFHSVYKVDANLIAVINLDAVLPNKN